MKWLAVLGLVVAAFALVFVLGRRIEGARDSAWQDAAARVQGRFQREPGPALLAQFGPGAPWTSWANDGELQCPRAILALDAEQPFALLQVRYSVRQRRGEEQPDDRYEVSVAAVRIPAGSARDTTTPVPAGAGYQAVHNGAWLFLWKQAPRGAGAALPARDMADLLERAREALRPLSPAGRPGSSAAPAGPAPAGRRTPP